MPHLPRPMERHELVAILKDVRTAIEANDSFEGWLRYEMPDPWLTQAQYERAPADEREMYVPLVPSGDRPPPPTNPDDPSPPEWELSTEAGQHWFMVSGVLRFGNSMGQGGLQIVGRIEADDLPTEQPDESLVPVMAARVALYLQLARDALSGADDTELAEHAVVLVEILEGYRREPATGTTEGGDT